MLWRYELTHAALPGINTKAAPGAVPQHRLIAGFQPIPYTHSATSGADVF